MKAIRHYLLYIFLTILFPSCSDFLEIDPKVNLSEANYYKTEQHAINAMAAVYNALAVQPWNNVPTQSDIFSDDAYTGGEPGGGMGQWQEQERSVISTENAAALDLWGKLYSGIYRANVYLEKEKNVEWKSEALRNRLKAEVLTLRAYFYWDLVRHYGWVPIVREYIVNVEELEAIPQATPEEVYTVIAEDLLDAIPNLPETVPSNEKGRITKDVAGMLIARIFLFREGFGKQVMGITNAWTDGETVIDKPYVQAMVDEIIKSGRYKLLDKYDDVFNWNNENNEESIFEWQYSEKGRSSWGNPNGAWSFSGHFTTVFYGPRSPKGDSTIAAGWSFGTITWSLVDEFEEGDPRLNTTVYSAKDSLTSYQKGYQNTGYFNYKYMPRAAYVSNGGDADLNYRINYKDMRFSELLLIGAELFLDTDPAKATEYLNRVRERAMGVSARKNSITLDDIYHERRVELGGEGHRKWDLLRRGLDYAKQKIDASWVVPQAESPGDFQGRHFDVNTWGMIPIPASEIRLVNPGMLNQYVPAFK